MISGRDIVIISSIDWNYLWQVHQEIALRLAQGGNRVIYIENTGVRAPRLSDAGRIARRLKSWSKSLRSRGLGEVAANIHVISPVMLPPFSSRGNLANRVLFSSLVRRSLKRLGVSDPILWTYLPTDTALDLIQELKTPKSLVIYYCVADFSQLTPHKQALREVERRLIQGSDLIFTNGSQLAQYCKQWSNDVHVFPPGVDFNKFPLENNGGPPKPPSPTTLAKSNGSFLGSLPRPIIGYVGGLHRFVDYDLLVSMVRARPQWSWAFIGPRQTPVGDLEKLSNAYLLGEKPHDELAALIKDFNVCLVPYVVNPSTTTVAPVKLNEYLALGKPVVSTELPTVCEFNQQHDVLITARNDSQHFLSAIEQALRLPADPEAGARRREIAALADWQNRFEAMNELIEEKIRIKLAADLRR